VTRDAPLAICDGVSRVFGSGPGAVVAVHGTSCVIDADARVAIIGSSGSGKSTLLHLLAGLEQPTVGSVTWPGLPAAPDRAFQIGVVFQSPSLIPALTVEENTALPLVLAGTSDAESRTLTAEALTAVGIDDLAENFPRSCLAGRVNESRSPGCSRSGRDSYLPMNPPGNSTGPAASV
jgi:putative ABC transport system ATP-binding protein